MSDNNNEAMRELMYRMQVGADQLIQSADEWAERLTDDEPSPLIARFIDQLKSEWLNAPPPDAICEQVMAKARARLSSWHRGWPHSWGHTLRVTGLTVAMAEAEGIDPALAFVAGMCHDVAKLDEFRTGEPHEQAGAQFAADVLKGYLSAEQIASIQAAILKEGKEPLRNILADADHLDKLGAAGIIRRVSHSTHQTALPTALWRVMDDAWLFPAMHTGLSDSLFRSKRSFQVWFLPEAEQAVSEW